MTDPPTVIGELVPAHRQRLTDRQAALCTLLDRPNPGDLVGLGHRVTAPAKSDRQPGAQWVRLVVAWAQHRIVDRETAW